MSSASHESQVPPIYCLSFHNALRRARLQRRLDSVGLTATFLASPPTPLDVQAMVDAKGGHVPTDFEYRTVAVMLSHVQMIRRFVEDTIAPHGIFCEDDIYLRRTIRRDLPAIALEFEARRLDVLLLGYLWPWREPRGGGDPDTYRFYEYDAGLWGTQMYMLSRRQAVELVQTYTLDYALAHAPAQPFSPDWIITKIGRRLRIYPMLAVEEGHVGTAHRGQIAFHRRCAEVQYDPALYV